MRTSGLQLEKGGEEKLRKDSAARDKATQWLGWHAKDIDQVRHPQ